ncbi:tRNA (adenosine(37)-N6)-threonylcarbamoyltransferase complex ATPase subunit type 1 TsaE [Marinicella sp. S1101]|uniref:tRNA (adenosine(37)-N6)-threonylcarbamoyltransferase complex ATPase subunit type 1 TsaE n=1 Tax=Marinicella marina TaxID=2996016 RepID=UPI00226087C9|nr:tRNA (adenosine(37)-N6)-threonylcarbamoyltransferase complex ATPase subunit type 1 TsaE [Marinicella marina]MCX7555132.1 tRNA (adenosine(37)-N6)-threonylcarbamoyltransferase complex ATPase subunit type 1 TsaE [Marinicella marina]MDJ1140341.1 tRNA (adenosine(37)-N6)-threonylcarbamoyltransferase complex ATPase subunit type 1 TsaE [Marinicella marina]
MKNTTVHEVKNLSQLRDVATAFKSSLKPGAVIYLAGDLGAGKTTFTQNLLAACGVKEHVKSPTYNLYETYQGSDLGFVHMDLYRLTDPEELYFLGIEDLIDGQQVLLVEWPDKGAGVMPKADWMLLFEAQNLNRTLTITSEK